MAHRASSRNRYLLSGHCIRKKDLTSSWSGTILQLLTANGQWTVSSVPQGFSSVRCPYREEYGHLCMMLRSNTFLKLNLLTQEWVRKTASEQQLLSSALLLWIDKWELRKADLTADIIGSAVTVVPHSVVPNEMSLRLELFSLMCTIKKLFIAKIQTSSNTIAELCFVIPSNSSKRN